MNHYEPRQHSDSKKWHYTCRRDGDVWAVGRCGEDGGHDTATEACSCYRSHLIDTARFGAKAEPPGPCRVPGCKRAAKELAEVQGFPYLLCEKHHSKEGLEKVFPAVGSAVSSY